MIFNMIAQIHSYMLGSFLFFLLSSTAFEASLVPRCDFQKFLDNHVYRTYGSMATISYLQLHLLPLKTSNLNLASIKPNFLPYHLGRATVRPLF